MLFTSQTSDGKRTTTVTVCIPALNAAPFLQETLDSVAVQTVTDWELIFFDDGSTDDTKRIYDNFAARVPQKCSYHFHAVSRGPALSRNGGIALANGKYLAFLDADDVWDSRHLEVLLSTISDSDSAVGFSGCQLIGASGEIVGEYVPSPGFEEELPQTVLYLKYTVRPSSMLAPKSLLLALGGYSNEFFSVGAVEDVDLAVRILRANYSLRYSGAITWSYRTHPANASSKPLKQAAGIAMLWKHHSDWERIPKSVRLTYAARGHLSAGKMNFYSAPADARRHFLEAWSVDRSKISYLGFALLTYGSRLLKLLKH